MRHRRHTITVASSTLFFVCLMLHAQTGLASLASNPSNDAAARKVYESLLPADWTLTVAHARRLLSQAKTSKSVRSYIVLAPFAFNIAASNIAAFTHTGHTGDLSSSAATFYSLEKNDGLWNSMRWRVTSRAWAS
jgi:hypothetical protein